MTLRKMNISSLFFLHYSQYWLCSNVYQLPNSDSLRLAHISISKTKFSYSLRFGETVNLHYVLCTGDFRTNHSVTSVIPVSGVWVWSQNWKLWEQIRRKYFSGGNSDSVVSVVKWTKSFQNNESEHFIPSNVRCLVWIFQLNF